MAEKGAKKMAIDRLVNLGVTQVEPNEQVHHGVVDLYVTVDDKQYVVVLDYRDHPDFINDEALEKSDLYIKCQYQQGGYDNDDIVPGGYPVTFTVYYKYYKAYRDMYLGKRKHKIVGRFGYEFQEEIRKKAVRLLWERYGKEYIGARGKVRYSRFLREVASSSLCLHLPGNGPFTHRVAEFLGLGSCMVSPRFTTELHVPLVPGEHYVEVADDLSDLIEKCDYYLNHHEEREKIAMSGREYFDRYLHCDEMAAYYVRMMLEKLGK